MDKSKDISVLIERAKELECLYLIDEALSKDSLSDILTEISAVTPSGFCYEKECIVTVVLDDVHYSVKEQAPDCHELKVDIVINDKIRGYIKAAYPQNIFAKGDIVFLPQEKKLLQAISNKIARIIYQKFYRYYSDDNGNWTAILKLLQNSNREMLLHVCEKMLVHLAAKNTKLVENVFSEMGWIEHKYKGEINYPLENLSAVDAAVLSEKLFNAASQCFDDKHIFEQILLWIYQRETYELIKIVNRQSTEIKDISKALTKYQNAVKANKKVNESTQRWLFVELIRRFLTDNPKQIEKIRKYVSVDDFCELLGSFVCSPQSKGKLGGKATGFFAANQIIKAHIRQYPEFENVRMPKTWFIPSGEMDYFLSENGLDELNEHKYRDMTEIRIIYPKIVQTFKNAKLSSYVINQLNQILDEYDNKPLIVRSSSLLEDHLNFSFSGKYKSLFVSNSGPKAKRLKELTDAILEVYASMYNPDGVQYRKERNLLDSAEQMGIMIQEAIGFRVGPYYFPLYAGVAFSNNELRWSPRIKREDGLVRVVMGLGTRAVDRVGDDYPVLISPGQANLSVNQAPEEIQKYSPQMLDAIDMENSRFVTVSIAQLIKEYGNEIPQLDTVLSVFKNDFISDFNVFTADYKKDNFVVSFSGLINKTPGIKRIKLILDLLKENLGYPVDIEFAYDGQFFYLLQCRPQIDSYYSDSVAIPNEISPKDTIFTADKYISNGKVLGIKTIIYVDPEEYEKLETYDDLINVASAVSELNRMLPRKSFILIGPGRWGSRGDIKLGVRVTYSDICNTAMIIEIANKNSKYQPELSFGTHFFQDLVEAGIKYLPLYPEREGTVFNSRFFSRSQNKLSQSLPAYSYLDKVIKVISIEEEYPSREMNVLLNADLEKAVAYLELASKEEKYQNPYIENEVYDKTKQEGQGWKWRHYMAEVIASKMDFDAFCVKGVYLFGSTNTCTAELNSDIDIIIHFGGTKEQKKQLDAWLDGWSKALSEMNYLKTGYSSDGLLDVHYVTDEDIKNKSSYAVKINSAYDPATLLRKK